MAVRLPRRTGSVRRPRRARRNDPRWLLPALGISLVVFLVAISNRSTQAPPGELPTPSAPAVGLGKPEPTSARLHVGEMLQIRVPGKPSDRFGTVISQSDDKPVLEVLGDPTVPPLLQGVSRGSVVVTVLLEPPCPPSGACRQYRRNLGAVRVTVDP